MASQYEEQVDTRTSRISVTLRNEDAILPLTPDLKLSVEKATDGKTGYKPGDEIEINWKLANAGKVDVTFTGLYLYAPADGKEESIQYHVASSLVSAGYNMKLRAGSVNEVTGTLTVTVPEEKNSADAICLYLVAEAEENSGTWVSESQKITLPRAK